ncbi:MAG: type VI secretion system baseplate subunit TssF, partial [Planctomycetes bacterium]|nr:type VI secretion system baseplate subunit TssF [Planctomycetota bacterium]
KLEDEFPELTTSLLELLYPHYLAPIPSMSIAQFTLDPNQGQLTDGFTIPRHSRLISRDVRGVPCRFQTAYPVTLWPIEISTSYLTAPFGSSVKLPSGLTHVEAMLRLELKLTGKITWPELTLDQLRLCLCDDERTSYQLYELLFNHCEGVFVKEVGGNASTVLPASSIAEVGFHRDEGLLPYDARSFIGYRLLTEYFAFPQKFLFADLTQLKEITSRVTSPKMEVCILLSKADRSLETRVDPETFRLGCSPIVNLFRHHSEPIRLTQTQTEYPVIPDIRHRRAYEIYSINEVTSTDINTGAITEYLPFFACRHGRSQDLSPTYWYSKRVPSAAK